MASGAGWVWEMEGGMDAPWEQGPESAPEALGSWSPRQHPFAPLLLTVFAGEPPTSLFPPGDRGRGGAWGQSFSPPPPAEWLRAGLGLRGSTTLAAPLACGAWGGRPSLPFVSSPTRLLLAFDGDSCGHCYSSCQLESRRGWAGSMCWIPGVMGAGGYPHPHPLQPLSSSDPTSIRRGPGFGFQNTQWPLSGSVGKGSPSQPRQATAQGRREN